MKSPARLILSVTMVVYASALSAQLAAASDPLVTLSATELRFGTQAQDTTSPPQCLILTNTGQADLTVNSITLSGENSGDFSQTSDCPSTPAVLPAGRSCEIHLLFHPRSSGPELTATVTISDNASGSPRSVTLRGLPSPPVPGITLAPTSLAFGSQPLATASAAHSIRITNSGSATLNLTSAIGIGGADAGEFVLAKSGNTCPDGSGQLAPRASCEINVIFSPVSAGAKSAQLEIMDDAAGSPHVVSLSGTAVPPHQ